MHPAMWAYALDVPLDFSGSFFVYSTTRASEQQGTSYTERTSYKGLK